MKEFYANNSNSKNVSDVVGVFGESFNFESFTGELTTPRTVPHVTK
jgi:hypothetical protein